MRRTSFAGIHCSLARSLEVIGDWWTPLILRDLYLGVTRFDDLVLDLGISRNLLASRLRALVANGLVERRRYQEHPPRFDHVLSEAGRELVPVLLALTDCGMLTFSDDQFRKSIEDDVGIKPEWAAETFTDLDADVRQSIARIKASPFIPYKDRVRGFVYDVASGRLREVR
jgi:DNA-binding HxlR family transcriptional regulator